MSAQHTAGPWAVSKQKARRVTASGVIICNAVLRNQGGPKHKAFTKDVAEAEANARLIAAAPELLEALEAIMEVRVQRHENIWAGTDRCREIARAAIAKATGGEA